MAAHFKSCSIDGCNGRFLARGLCAKHYRRLMVNGSTDDTLYGTKRTCSVEGCDRPFLAKDMCSLHYYRVKNGGDIVPKNTPKGDLLRWLQDHVDHDGEECIIWPFGTTGNGYGKLQVNGREYIASNYMCRLAHGDQPTEAHETAHNCNNPPCCNPKHLRWDTRAGNHADKYENGTHQGSTKLNARQVTAIRSLNGVATQQEIADMFGVSRSNVGLILNRITWTHI